jgi:cobalt-zinc-cadmium efflux system protein
MGHNHSHDHDHDHGHHHHHHAVGRVGVAFALNLAFALIELVGGVLTNSMAVMSDALHDFGDALALGMGWWLEKKSHQQSDPSYTYGYRRLSVASAFVTGVILVSGSLWIISNAVPRILHPEPVKTQGMLALAILGIVVNGVAFWRLSHGHSLNEKMMSWHFIEDLFGWVIVLIGSVVMLLVDWPWLDPLLAVLLSGWVLKNVVGHLWKTMSVFLQASPEHLREGQAESWIRGLPGVSDVHHMHIWSLDGVSHILTAHVVVPMDFSLAQMETLKVEIKRGLREQFHVQEATIEFESSAEACLDPKH